MQGSMYKDKGVVHEYGIRLLGTSYSNYKKSLLLEYQITLLVFILTVSDGGKRRNFFYRIKENEVQEILCPVNIKGFLRYFNFSKEDNFKDFLLSIRTDGVYFTLYTTIKIRIEMTFA